MKFKKSSFCAFGCCVEVAFQTAFKRTKAEETHTGGGHACVHIRSSNKPGQILTCSWDEWLEFIKGVKNGEFDFKD